VKKGETLSHIASEYEVTIKELRRVNEIGVSSTIRAGNILLIPVKDMERATRVASRPSYRNPQQPIDPISLPLLSAADGGKRIRYVVRKGDTLVKIAERFHASLAQLREWNDLSYESVIRPGDTLSIRMSGTGAREETATGLAARGAAEAGGDPPASNSDDPAATNGAQCISHVIKKGETLTSIGRLYRVSISDILAWNPGVQRNKLYPGKKLKIWLEAG